METWWYLLIPCFTTIASFFGVIGGGATLIDVPLYLLFGFPPVQTIASRKIGSIGGKFTVAWRLREHIDWRIGAIGAILFSAGSYIGAHILLNLPEDIITKMAAIICLALIPIIIFKDIGIERKKYSKKRQGIGYSLLAMTGVYSGGYSPGVGVFNAQIMLQSLGLTFKETIATRMFIACIGYFVPAIIFIFAGVVDWLMVILMLLSTTLGGYLATHIGIKKGDKTLKKIFIASVFVMALLLLI